MDNQTIVKEKVRRRSKKDLEGREFVCSCGKKYLSYPALYTHNKTKHDGNMPMTEKPKKVKTCDDAFFEYFKENQIQESFLVIDLLKECLNLRGFQMDKETPNNEEVYCRVKKPNRIPLMINFFLLKFLPFKNHAVDKELAESTAEKFCSWLLEKKYTDLTLDRLKTNKN